MSKQLETSGFVFDIPWRVRYAETDQMGYVHHGNYAAFYESGRTELMRSLGVTYASMERDGVMMPVVELHCRYHRALLYDDLITIRTILRELPRATVTFHQQLIDSRGALCHEGYVKLAFVDAVTRRPMRAPEGLVACFARAMGQ